VPKSTRGEARALQAPPLGVRLARELILAFATLGLMGAAAVGEIVIAHYYPAIETVIRISFCAVIALACAWGAWRWWRRRNSD
jgi:hypothetical protein